MAPLAVVSVWETMEEAQSSFRQEELGTPFSPQGVWNVSLAIPFTALQRWHPRDCHHFLCPSLSFT